MKTALFFIIVFLLLVVIADHNITTQKLDLLNRKLDIIVRDYERCGYEYDYTVDPCESEISDSLIIIDSLRVK